MYQSGEAWDEAIDHVSNWGGGGLQVAVKSLAMASYSDDVIKGKKWLCEWQVYTVTNL